MPALTQKQLEELGHQFLALAQAVGNFRYTKKLSRQANKNLSDLHWTLLNYSDDLYTASAKIALSNVDKSLEKIAVITRGMHRSLAQIKYVQKAIDVATAAATLGATLFSKNILAINEALDKLVKEWEG
jgi:hypothetical protein